MNKKLLQSASRFLGESYGEMAEAKAKVEELEFKGKPGSTVFDIIIDEAGAFVRFNVDKVYKLINDHNYEVVGTDQPHVTEAIPEEEYLDALELTMDYSGEKGGTDIYIIGNTLQEDVKAASKGRVQLNWDHDLLGREDDEGSDDSDVASGKLTIEVYDNKTKKNGNFIFISQKEFKASESASKKSKKSKK